MTCVEYLVSRNHPIITWLIIILGAHHNHFGSAFSFIFLKSLPMNRREVIRRHIVVEISPNKSNYSNEFVRFT